ncbi:phosphoglycerate mutase-like protein [Gautieria morchelliformis]|nr:phosphoglycerate mutase-like protein [Gautieria morchelliformis]
MSGNNVCIVAVLALTQLVTASFWPRAQSFSAAPSAGATVSGLFPPNVTESFDASSVFPGGDVVGFPGPTPTGDEAAAIITAPVAAPVESYYPLINPPTLDHKKTNVPHLWGNLAPWYSLPSGTFGLPNSSPQVPTGYKLNSVHLWHRHGARYPTGGSAPSAFAAKLHNAVVAGTGFTATGDLEFLNTWTFELGAEILTPFGREQLFDLGVGFRVKYGTLLNNFKALPVFRTTSEDRMLASALNFAAGFFGIPMFQTDYHQVIVIESSGFNNSGAPYDTCVNSNLPIGNFGGTQSNIWIGKYLQNALTRLQPQISGINLTTSDVFAMQQTCAYETVALGFSTFCGLFTQEEWNGFEYSNDLSFWYSEGPGSPVAAAQGMGYVQELVARLTHTPIQIHNTTTNSTIDNNPITMPLDQPIYIDATHDVVIANLLVALNFTTLAGNGPLPTDHIPNGQTYFVNQIAPFGSNLVGQVLSCSSSNTSYIRFILNDGVVPLTGIKGCTASPDGLCELDTFISAMKERISEVDFAFDCLANYTIADPTQITDGRPPPSVRPTV